MLPGTSPLRTYHTHMCTAHRHKAIWLLKRELAPGEGQGYPSMPACVHPIQDRMDGEEVAKAGELLCDFHMSRSSCLPFHNAA